MNSITELLDLEDADISITDIRIEGRKKFLSLETKLETHFCKRKTTRLPLILYM